MTRVLLADDSGTMRTIIRRSLEALGVRGAVEAPDGNQAVALFKPGEYDLVLTDWNMPGKSGVEIVREIRSQDPSVPILMVTTETEPRVLDPVRKLGVLAVVEKAFPASVVSPLLDSLFGSP